MAKSPAKPSVSKSKPIKYSLSYVRVSTKDQLDGSGIKKKDKKKHIKNGLEEIKIMRI